MDRLRWYVVCCLVGAGWLPMTLTVAPAVAQEKATGDKPITISADHLEVNRKLRTAVYTGNVTADDKNRCMVIMSDKMEFFFDEAMEQIERGLASGNVKITAGERRITSEQLELFPADDRAVLTGDPRVWQDNDLLTGTKITLFLKEDRAVVEGGPGKRVTAILYPRSGSEETSKSDGGERKAKPAAKKNGC